MAKKKLSLFTDDMILYIEIQRVHPKIARTHTAIQQCGRKQNQCPEISGISLYTNNETEEREIKESIPLTIAPKSIRYLGKKLTKEVKDLYPKNYRTLLKGIEEDTKRWKNNSMLMDWKI